MKMYNEINRGILNNIDINEGKNVVNPVQNLKDELAEAYSRHYKKRDGILEKYEKASGDFVDEYYNLTAWARGRIRYEYISYAYHMYMYMMEWLRELEYGYVIKDKYLLQLASKIDAHLLESRYYKMKTHDYRYSLRRNNDLELMLQNIGYSLTDNQIVKVLAKETGADFVVYTRKGTVYSHEPWSREKYDDFSYLNHMKKYGYRGCLRINGDFFREDITMMPRNKGFEVFKK